jgi:hypothetical protein
MLVGHRRTAAILRSVPALASACRIRLANAYCKIFTPMDAKTFRKFRTPAVGEKMILEGNVFVEKVLPAGIVRKLADEEMSVYRAPFATPESRRPTWRTNCDSGKPVDVYSTLEKAHRALALTRSCFSQEIQAFWYRRPSLRALRRDLRTAELCISALAVTTCRRIMLRSSELLSMSG